MTKKHFIELANRIKAFNEPLKDPVRPLAGNFTPNQIFMLADFCESQNPRFDRQLWLDYIAGRCGPNGGKITRKEG